MATVETTVYTTLAGDDEPIEELPAEIITYGYRHNGPGAFEFKLSVDHEKCDPSVIYPRRHEVVVVRNEQIVWRGPVLTAVEDAEFVTFRGAGLLWYLRKMHVTATLGLGTGWTGTTDQALIVQALVDHHQDKAGGDFGIDTSGISAQGVTRQGVVWYAWEYKNIWDAVVQLGERINGFDFAIDPATRALILYHPKRGSRKTNLVWDERNIRDFGRTIDGTAQASQVLAAGEGEGEKMVRVTRQDAGAVAEYRLTQEVHQDKDIRLQSSLRDRADTVLRTVRVPETTLSLVVSTDDPPIFSYEEGDEGRVSYSSPYERVVGFRRVVGRDIKWNQGEEQATLHLEEI